MIIDTHTHFYDPNRPEHHWPPEGRDLYWTCLPERYKALAEPEGVTGTVVVEASPQLVDNEWILSLAEEDPFLKGFVGNIPLGSDDFDTSLGKLAGNPLFVGMRSNWGETGQLLQQDKVDDIKKLRDRDLELDLLCGVEAIQGLPELIEKVPGLRVVINHLGAVRINGIDPPAEEWVEAVKGVSDLDTVYMKVSALVENNQKEENGNLADYLPVLDCIWENFGEDRVIYGSNWPVSARFADYSVVQRLPTEYLQGKSDEASRKYFFENSKAAYKWPDR